MCPDNQIISLYIDNELPSPWKEKMETHLVSCTSCRTRLAEYRKLHALLVDDSGTAMEAARERVWANLAEDPDNTDAPFSVVRAERKTAWNRTISLPVPAAAAAAAVFFITAFLAVMGLQPELSPGAAESAVAGIRTDLQGIVPVSDMNSVFEYLSGQDMGDSVTIQLPDSRSFSSYGEPALLKAADYSGAGARRRAVSP